MAVVNGLSLTLSAEEVAGLPGLQSKGQLHPKIGRLIPKVLETVREQQLIAPAVSYTVNNIEEKMSGKVRLTGGVVVDAPLLAHRLATASHLMVGVITIGPDLARQTNRWSVERDYVKAMILDEIGTATLFKLSDVFEGISAQEACKRGLMTSGPLNAGDDEGFDLTQQHVLMDLAEASKINVTLSGKSVMMPGKTLSVVIGLGKRMKAWSRDESCATCTSRDICRHRRTTTENLG